MVDSSTADDSGSIAWRAWAGVVLVGIAAVTAVAAISQFWVLTALPIGLLFGFLLQKGDVCGAWAFSETIMFRDRSKLFGIWVVIVVAMVGFALLDGMNLVTLNPKPFLYLSY